jgi:NitT/TauT family transport system permease protein
MIGDPKLAWLRQLLAFCVLLVVWQAAGYAGLLNPLYMPTPLQIWGAFVELFADGRIWPHIEATFTAALAGLALGIVVGIVLGVVAALARPVAELLEPVMLLVAVVIFFTVFTGIRQVDRRLVERIVTLGGGRWDLLRHVYLPSVAAWVLGNLKVAVGFAFTGAVVGEFVAASRGLGYLLSFAQSTYNASLMLAIVLLIMAVVLVIFALAGRLEKRLLRWN